MPMLIIGEVERTRIAEVIAHAKQHPLSIETVIAGAVDSNKTVVKLEDRKPGFERPATLDVIFPGNYRAAYSVEEQPSGFCTHLSVSVFGRAKKGQLPSPEAVAMIAEAFAVPFPADLLMWQEEFDPGEYAINLLSQLSPPRKEGSC